MLYQFSDGLTTGRHKQPNRTLTERQACLWKHPHHKGRSSSSSCITSHSLRETGDQLPSEVIPSKELPMIWWIPFPRYLPHAAAIWLTHDDRSSCPTTAGATGNPGVPRGEPPCRKPPAGAGSLLRAANRGTVAHRKSETTSSHFYSQYKNQTHLILWGLFGKLAEPEMAGKKKKRGHKTKSQSEEQQVASPGWRSPKGKPASQLQPS